MKSFIKELISVRRRKSLLKKMHLADVVEKYSSELVASGIIDEIYAKQREFAERTKGAIVRGHKVSFGGLGEEESKVLYALIRHFKPNHIVETGVCNGVSSYIMLLALEENDRGKLHSIDLPEVANESNSDQFWEGKGGAAIPSDTTAGWIVPQSLKKRWDLRLGNSFTLLPALMKELSEIDMFIHDSEHSYKCMSFEYNAAWPYLSNKGILLSDDIIWNNAFSDFKRSISSSSIMAGQLSTHLGVIFKK